MSKVITFLAQRRKALVALLGGVLAWAQLAYVPDGTVDRTEWYALAVTVAAALGVHAVSNAPLDSAVNVVRRALGLDVVKPPAAATTIQSAPPTYIVPTYPPVVDESPKS